MPAKHNPERYGELWNQKKIDIMKAELVLLKDNSALFTLSGGWAWHAMSPEHEELKHCHDHKDIDMFVHPQCVTMTFWALQYSGYEKEETIYDNHLFHRYVKTVDGEKVILDVFTGDVPRFGGNGFSIVEPEHLLSLYGKIHQTVNCFSVTIARELLAKGIHPYNRPEMVDYTRFLEMKGKK